MSKEKALFYVANKTHPKYVRQDLSRKTEKVFKEVPAWAYDEETGEFLNKSSEPKNVEIGEVNIYEKIQGYKEECDIYSILTNFAKSGDTTIINRKVGTFGDFGDLPDNVNDFFNNKSPELVEKLKQYSPQMQKAILENDYNKISALIADEVKAQLIKQGYIKDTVKIENKESE